MGDSVSDTTLSILSRFVTARLGLSFPPERFGDLERGLVSAARELGFKDAASCVSWLLSSSLSRRQIEVLASYLTVGETYFFRDHNLFKVMEDEILPGLIRQVRPGTRHLRVWSAGCASGEEAFSIAILLHQLIPDLAQWSISILATDINPIFLKRAQSGIYSQWSFREAPKWIQEKYFSKEKDSRYRIAPWIKKMVRFSYLNLAEDSYPSLTNSTNAMDLIFCRNVLMYFEPQRAESVIRKLHRALVDGGWLFVSPCEVSHEYFRPFVTVSYNDATFYRKDEHRPPAVELPAWREKARLPGFVSEPDPTWFAESPPPSGFTFPAPPPEPPDFLVQPPLEAPATPEPQSNVNEQAQGFFDQGLYQEAAALLIESASTGSDSKTMTLLARTLANQGKLAEAKEWCDKAVALDKLNPGLHYLMGMIFHELGQPDPAVASLKRALYLDPDFVLAHFMLANIHRGTKRFKESDKNFNNAFELLSKMEPDRTLPESEGLTAGRLKEIIESTWRENGDG